MLSWRRESRGPLHGIPLALKDLIDTASIRTTGGSALFKGRYRRRRDRRRPYLLLYNLALLLGFAFIYSNWFSDICGKGPLIFQRLIHE